MPRIAFATYQGLPSVTEDDQLLVDALREEGIDVDAMPWDASIDWSGYAAVLPRSTWDFHHRVAEFRAWVNRLEVTGARLINPGAVIRWNMTKHYLAALQAQRVPIVPTAWVRMVPGESTPSLPALARTVGGAGGVVVKPTVSASAHDTWRVDAGEMELVNARFLESLARAPEGLMVQPFLPEIQSRGEWSLIFICGAYSHAVLKRPADGDFRVQRDHGGTASPAIPPTPLIDGARRVLAAAAMCTGLAATDFLYARIDGVEQDHHLLLMEFEAIEPVLFFASERRAAARFAAALQVMLRRAHRA